MNNRAINPRHIGFDIDGVVADTMEAFIRLAREDYGVDTISPEDITDFAVEDCLPMDAGHINEIFERLMTEPLKAGLKPMAHAAAVLKEMSLQAPLVFITARPEKEPIDQWLREVLGRSAHQKAFLVATGEHDGKAEYIKQLRLKYFVDDRAETCQQLKEEGITPLVFSQPWNRGKHSLPAVENWRAIRSLCLPAVP